MSYCKNLLEPNLARAKATTSRALRLIGRVSTIAFIAVLCANPAQAKFEDYLTKRWFGIEVIVFERSNIDDKNTLEALASPHPSTDPSTNLNLAEAIDTSVTLSEPLTSANPADLITAADAIIGAPEPTEQRLTLETQIFDEAPNNEGTSKETLRLDFLEAINAYELELASRNLTFEADANPRLEDELLRLQRPRNNTILWRGNWLQAVPTRDEPQPLEVAVNELESGEFQLTGSIEVTVARYLHLHAQLWYHDPAFGAAIGGELVSQETLAAMALTTPAASEGLNNSTGNRFDEQALAPSRSRLLSTEQPQLEPLFMVLDETRRMRSGILHYLDHPKLGLLVRIDKVKIPEELLAKYKLFEASQK